MKETAMESELKCVISGFLCEVSKICVTVWCCGQHCGITLSTFRFSLTDRPWRSRNPRGKRFIWFLYPFSQDRCVVPKRR